MCPSAAGIMTVMSLPVMDVTYGSVRMRYHTVFCDVLIRLILGRLRYYITVLLSALYSLLWAAMWLHHDVVMMSCYTNSAYIE